MNNKHKIIIFVCSFLVLLAGFTWMLVDSSDNQKDNAIDIEVTSESVNTEQTNINDVLIELNFTRIDSSKAYDNNTKQVYYFVIAKSSGCGGFSYGYGFMSPYYMDGYTCKFVDGEIVPVIT